MDQMVLVCLLCCAIVALSSCPTGKLAYTTRDWYMRCIEPSECRRRNMVIDGQTCSNSCSWESHFFDKDTKTCYDTCPSDMVVEGHLCINKRTCTDKEQVVLNGVCAGACSDSYPLLDDSVCCQQCPSERVANGTVCVPKNMCVQSGSFVYNHTCVESCPITSGLKKDGECFSSCPEGSVSNGTVCINDEDCFGMKKVIFNKTCLIDCPPLAPYNIKNRCYNHCPSGFKLDSTICISENDCKRKLKVVYEGLCVDACPSEAPYLVEKDNTCKSYCPQGDVRKDMSCISEIMCSSVSGLYNFVFNGTCVESCPLSAPLDQNHVCVNECEESFLKSKASCITKDACKSTGFAYHRICVSHCPEGIPIIYNRECRNDCGDDLVLNGTTCVTEYDCDGLIYNRTCVPQCPEISPIVSDSQCLDKCPDRNFEDGNRCIPAYKCSEKNAFQFEGKCLDECPSEAPIECKNVCQMNCTSKCIDDFYSLEQPLVFNGSKCITHKACKEMGMVENNHACTLTCSPWTIPQTEQPIFPFYIDDKLGTVDVCRPVVNLYWGTAIIAVCFILCLTIAIRLWYAPRGQVQMERQKKKPPVNPDDGVILEINDDENNQRLNPEGEENPRILDVEDNGGMDRQMYEGRMNEGIHHGVEGKEREMKNKRRKNKYIAMVDVHSRQHDLQPLLDVGDEESDDSEIIEV